MNTLIHADIFFFISSIGFILLTILFATALVYTILIARRLLRIVKNIEEGIQEVGEEVKAFTHTLSQSRLLAWFFGRQHSKKKK